MDSAGDGARDGAPSLELSGPLAAVLDRGFTKRYRLDAGKEPGNDLYVHQHGNGLLVVGLAPTHKLLGGPREEDAPMRVKKIRFREDVCDAEVHGKRNKGGLKVTPQKVLADAELADGSSVSLLAAVEAQLVEPNTLIAEEPALLQDDPEGAGHIAVLQPRRPQDVTRILSTLVDDAALVSTRGSAAVARGRRHSGPKWAPLPSVRAAAGGPDTGGE